MTIGYKVRLYYKIFSVRGKRRRFGRREGLKK